MSRVLTAARDAAPHVGLEHPIETPENVVLAYRLAGPSIRMMAYALDLMVLVCGFALLAFGILIFGLAMPGLAAGIIFLLIFSLSWGYFVASEMLTKGRSFGKWVFGLRVVHTEGHPLSFWGSLIRNFLRVADILPIPLLYGMALPIAWVPLYGTGFVVMLLSPRLQRIGDHVARTVVITERQVVLPREPVIIERIEPLSRDDLGSWVPPETTLAMIEQFLGRRHVLSHSRGHALASVLAGPLASRLNYRGDPKLVEQYPMAFLARVYVTFLRRPEEENEEEFETPRRRSATPKRRKLARTSL